MTNPSLDPSISTKAQLEGLLSGISRLGATSVCIMAGQPPLVRVQGTLVNSDEPALTAGAVEDLCRSFLFDDHWRQLKRGREVRVLYHASSGDRYRTTVMRLETGLKVSFACLPQQIPTFEALGLPELLSSFVEFRSGLVVLTGFMGSGKSTTLASMVDRVNQTFAGHIVTIERPVEHIYRPATALVHQREVGVHVASFAEGVRDAVRNDGDVVMVGDLQDCETLLAVLDAAERGLLVLTTVHASGVVGALHEMVNSCPPAMQERVRSRLSLALRALVSQSLIRRAQTSGCVPLHEIMINSPSVQTHVRAGSFGEIPAIMERSRGLGMQVADQGLRTLINRNLITIEEARLHASNSEILGGRTPRRALADSLPGVGRS